MSGFGRNYRVSIVKTTPPRRRRTRERRREVITMLKVTLRYARYALAALSTVAFGLTVN